MGMLVFKPKNCSQISLSSVQQLNLGQTDLNFLSIVLLWGFQWIQDERGRVSREF